MEAADEPKAVRFEVVEIRPNLCDDGQLAFWCPWCEAPHYHGACGGNGNGRTSAHCFGDKRSPLITTGIDLVTIGTVDDAEAIIPKAAMAGRPPFRWMLQHHSAALRKAAIRAILGVSIRTAGMPAVIGSLGRTVSVFLFGRAVWRVEPRDDPDGAEDSGFGFLSLAALLYGLPPGVVAVRLLEEVSAETFDAETALAIQAAVDAWVAKGSPVRERL